jgi:hypothetical protein
VANKFVANVPKLLLEVSLSQFPFPTIISQIFCVNEGPVLRVRPEENSPFDSLTAIWYRSVLEFFGYLLPVKSYSTFSICM